MCVQKEVNVTKQTSASIQVSRSCGMYGIHGDSKREVCPMARITTAKYTGSNTSRASLSGLAKERRGGTRVALPAFHKLGYLNGRQMSQNGAQSYSYS